MFEIGVKSLTTKPENKDRVVKILSDFLIGAIKVLQKKPNEEVVKNLMKAIGSAIPEEKRKAFEKTLAEIVK
jgi:hypothetical protein